MSGDWLTDSQEFTDRMMTKIEASAKDLGDAVEFEMSPEMVVETLREMGVCDRCGLKRHCECATTEGETDA